MLAASLQPIAKALTPVILAGVAATLQWAISGTFDGTEIATAVTGVLSGAAVYTVPNTDPA